MIKEFYRILWLRACTEAVQLRPGTKAVQLRPGTKRTIYNPSVLKFSFLTGRVLQLSVTI